MANVRGEIIDGEMVDGVTIPPGRIIEFEGGPIVSDVGGSLDIDSPIIAPSVTFPNGTIANTAVPTGTYYMTYPYPFSSVATGGLGLSANVLGLWRFTLCYSVVVNKVVLEITGTVNTEKVGVTIYNAAGSSKLIDVTYTLGAGNGIINAAPAGAPVTLPAGTYLLGVANTNISIAYRCQAVNTAYVNIQNNQAASLIFATGANASVAGVNPATTGALTASAAINFPLIAFVT